jgi:hypothetical protein
MSTRYWLVVWNICFFPYIGNVIIPTDFHSIIFQKGKYTTNQGNIAGYYLDTSTTFSCHEKNLAQGNENDVVIFSAAGASEKARRDDN